MTTSQDFAGFDHVSLVEGSSDSSVIYNVYGPADVDLIPVFAEFGDQGNGYDWQSAVAGYLTESDAESLQRVRFAPEADMFCAHGEDLSALHTVATTVEKLLADAEKLREALRAARRHGLQD